MRSTTHALAITAALLLTACATAPAHLTAAKAAVDGRKAYVHYIDTPPLSELGGPTGNCVAFALDYAAELRAMGYKAPLATACVLPDGTGHAVLDVDGWRLDNREARVIPVWASECLNSVPAFSKGLK